ncbi:hypothetical protein Tco_1516679 [Tanacetum coccineum]
MVSATKDPLTFNDLMATPIDFSKYVLNGLKIDNLTQDILLDLIGIIQKEIVTLFDLSKSLPLQGPPCHRTFAVDYFFNNDLEYQKTSDPEVTYTTSITKTKTARNFVDLHMNDIEDMLLLAVQHKLFHLTDNDIVDFIVALRMFTRSLVIKKRVEDLQLGKQVMRADELYKFLDGTLKKVRDELHHRVLDFFLGYNKEMERRKWTATDKKRFALMVELIDKQMRERKIIWNLERLVGARELEMDYKLMTRTI